MVKVKQRIDLSHCGWIVIIPFLFVLSKTESSVVVTFRDKQSLEMRQTIQQTLIVRIRVHS